MEVISHTDGIAITFPSLCNWFQVKILMKDGEELEVPEFDDIYAQSEVSDCSTARDTGCSHTREVQFLTANLGDYPLLPF